MNASLSSAPIGWQRRIFWALFLFTLAVTLGTLLGEAFKTRLIGYMRFADFEDMVINGLLFLFSFVLLNDLFVEAKARRGLRVAFLVLSLLFIFGYGMRIASNSVNTFATEIRDYKSIIPADMYALLYFFDENLAHLIIYLSRYGLFACLLILEDQYLASKENARPQLWALATGILYGFWEAIVFLEGQKLYLIPLVMVGLGTVWVILWRQSRLPIGKFMKNGPVTAFMVGLLVIPIGLGLWALLTGGLCEPSQYFMGRCK
jgi:hypothetical protein